MRPNFTAFVMHAPQALFAKKSWLWGLASGLLLGWSQPLHADPWADAQRMVQSMEREDKSIDALGKKALDLTDAQSALRRRLDLPGSEADKQKIVLDLERIAREISAVEMQRATARNQWRKQRDTLLDRLEGWVQQSDEADNEDIRIQWLVTYAKLLASRTSEALQDNRGALVMDLNLLTTDEREELSAFLLLQQRKLSNTIKDLESLQSSIQEHRRLSERRARLSEGRRLFEEDLEDRMRSAVKTRNKDLSQTLNDLRTQTTQLRQQVDAALLQLGDKPQEGNTP